MTQSFLETGQGHLLVTGLDIDHPIRRKPCCFKPWCKQILIPYAPKNLTLGARHDAGGKQSRGRAIQCAIGGACDLMQGAEGQAATGQAPIHLHHAEGQHPRKAAVRRLEPADFFAQNIDGGR